MPDKTPCVRCQKPGLVRFENVIKGGRAERHFYCGGCHYSWQVADDGTPTKPSDADDDVPPERSRPGR